MKAYLKGSAEEINFESQQVQHFLVFQREDGSTFRLPVGEETTQSLVAILTGQVAPEVVPTTAAWPTVRAPVSQPGPVAVSTSLDADGATEFGGDGGMELTPEDTESLEAESRPSFEVHDPSESQPTEDEVQSL